MTQPSQAGGLQWSLHTIAFGKNAVCVCVYVYVCVCVCIYIFLLGTSALGRHFPSQFPGDHREGQKGENAHPTLLSLTQGSLCWFNFQIHVNASYNCGFYMNWSHKFSHAAATFPWQQHQHRNVQFPWEMWKQWSMYREWECLKGNDVCPISLASFSARDEKSFPGMFLVSTGWNKWWCPLPGSVPGLAG